MLKVGIIGVGARGQDHTCIYSEMGNPVDIASPKMIEELSLTFTRG